MNTMGNFFLLFIYLFWGVCALLAKAKPNLVVFISDDLGRLDTSIHGSKDVRTPTMDLLAAGGMTSNRLQFRG